METTECNEATFPSSGHRDSPPSLLSLGVHAQASSPSPPGTQQHASFPPLPYAPFSASSPHLFSIISLSSASHRNSFCIHSLSSGLISVSIHCSKSQSGGGVCRECNCYKTKKIMQDVIWHKHQFLTILLIRRWRSVGSNTKLEHIQYLCLYVSFSSDLATLQGSPQKHMGTGTPLDRGNESKAFSVIWP